MNQIYNLSQTISEDKEIVAALEKQLLNAKSILAAHEDAMKRLTTVPNVIASVNKETSVTVGSTVSKGASVNRERITYENNTYLDIMEGDKVDVVVNGDPDVDFKGVYDVTELSDSGITPFRLRGDWYEFDDCNDESELYLIRTPEGSLNNQ
tara:strand:+ start:478 stop:933 length:456 start_codon:yes stop_codon:yes gene_type:complete